MTNAIVRDKYCMEGCPMDKIIQKEQEEHNRHLQWIKEHKVGHGTLELSKDRMVSEVASQDTVLCKDSLEVTSKTSTDASSKGSKSVGRYPSVEWLVWKRLTCEVNPSSNLALSSNGYEHIDISSSQERLTCEAASSSRIALSSNGSRDIDLSSNGMASGCNKVGHNTPELSKDRLVSEVAYKNSTGIDSSGFIIGE